MFIEVHVLQNYALSNLNRDDTGAPKTCEFGGVRRARISSQCLKRAVRTYFRDHAVVPANLLSKRTKRLKEALADRIAGQGIPEGDAVALAGATIEQLGLKLEKDKTQYLLLLGNQEMDKLAALAVEHRNTLLSPHKPAKGDKTLQGLLWEALDGGDAIDLALFGRMIADKPDHNVDAAVQMAHAISTHAVSTEFDFYSAVDDLQRDDAEEGAGAGMLGTILYNSSCYYRYANVDFQQLLTNLGGDAGKAETGVRAFLQGMIHAVPTGKQTGSAAQNPPALIMVTVRDTGLWSLANAFVKPVQVRGDQDIVALSAQALMDHFGQLCRMYGADPIRYAGVATYLDVTDVPAPAVTEESAPALVDAVMNVLAAARR
ncbi:MAG TPA: type I-E CRISPR-associated protein Cas7/Cse4/CasC [Trueperaceae bacterium]